MQVIARYYPFNEGRPGIRDYGSILAFVPMMGVPQGVVAVCLEDGSRYLEVKTLPEICIAPETR
jgi:hypothetical protein